MPNLPRRVWTEPKVTKWAYAAMLAEMKKRPAALKYACNTIQMIRRIYIGNLPLTMENKTIFEHFSKFGEVTGVEILCDPESGISRGFGYVVFSNNDGVSKAIESNTHVIEGSNIKVYPKENYGL